MRIGLVESYYGGSHRLWADGICRNLHFDVDLYTLSDHHWKWRMHGGAVSLARQIIEASANGRQPELLLVTSMTDLCILRSLLAHAGIHLPTVYYFHENQLSYPWSPNDPDVASGRDRHYAFIHFASALAADHVLFNSAWHLKSFTEAIPRFCAAFPKPNLIEELNSIKAKSSVLHLGLDLSHLIAPKREKREGPPTILWNHRWEYDKSPEAFFNALFQLDQEGIPFKLIVTGASYAREPACFADARNRLSHRLLHFGYANNRKVYEDLLLASDILPVTAVQDFFGISTVEALAAGAWPLLPAHRVYAEHEPDARFMYKQGEFTTALRHLITGNAWRNGYPNRARLARYDWSAMAPLYAQCFSDIFHTFRAK